MPSRPSIDIHGSGLAIGKSWPIINFSIPKGARTIPDLEEIWHLCFMVSYIENFCGFEKQSTVSGTMYISIECWSLGPIFSMKRLLVIVFYCFGFGVRTFSPHLIFFSNVTQHCEVYRVYFWMTHHGSKSPKRTVVVSSSRHISRLDLGSLKVTKLKKKSTTTRRYIDHAGKRRYCGTKALKETQKLTSYRSTLFFSLFHYSDDISNKFPMCFPVNSLSFPQGHILQALPVLWLICFHTCRRKKKRHLST